MDQLIDKLRRSTSHLHREAEGLLLNDLEQTGQEEYRFFLRVNLTFHQAYEPAVSRASFTGQEEWKSFDRGRLDKLIHDTGHLNMHSGRTEFSDRFQDWPEHKLLGAAYVSEGSTLGGQVVLRNLKKKSFFDEEQCGRFLTGLGANTGKAWKAFLVLLEREGSENPNEVVDGAVEAFELFIEIARLSRSKP